jgi:murein DD-endopeptidase MepM/ murein hydrolase activator NlpD
VAGNRRWTILIVPHGAHASRGLEVSARAFKWLAGFGSVALTALLVFAIMTVTKSIDLSRLDRMESVNQALTQELEIARQQMTELKDTITAITVRDREMRLVAGLVPTNADVQMAGIGGPVQWSGTDSLLAEDRTGREALDLRLELDGLIRRAGLLAGSFVEASESLSSHHDRMQRTPSIMPTLGYLSSKFARSRIHPIFHEARAHEGIDISAPMGTPIQASAGGLVVDVGNQGGYGLIVTLDHGYGLVTRYAHLSKTLVRTGQRVKRGDNIAEVGRSGIATAPHLHYEVMVRGQQQDPLKYIFPEGIVD